MTDLDDDNNMNPLIKTDECTFAFIKHSNLYVVATTRKNSNIAMLFALLHKICQVKMLILLIGYCENRSSTVQYSKIFIITISFGTILPTVQYLVAVQPKS